MITTRVIPVATATAQELLIEVTENLCRPYCINGTNQPSATVTFSVVSTREINGSTIATINAVVTTISPNGKCSCANSQVFTESFNIAFESTGTNTVTLAAGDNTIVEPAYIKCYKAGGIKLTATLTATIA